MSRLDRALQRLLVERRRLELEQGRIARRNGRRAVIGALRSVRLLLDQEYPAIAKPAAVVDPIDVAARRLSWRRFEYGVIAHLRLDWDLALASAFNEQAAAELAVAPKPIVLDSGIRGKGWLGLHDTDCLRIATGLSREGKWRTLLHEVAHYRVHDHRRAFVLELARVYRMWKQFREERRVAARRIE